jgi:EAL domain-containing protein (putative c-di-GMP-specific phosphodiesterase class I)
MLQVSAETAISSAGAALWTWRSSDDCLSIRADAGGPLAHLDGRWRLEAFLDLMEAGSASSGLSRLARGQLGEKMDVRLRLRDGRRVHLIGSFHDEGVARGLIVTGDRARVTGLERSPVEPVYQPIRRLSDLEVVGFEALARFRSPEGRLAAPSSLEARGLNADWAALAPVMLAKSAQALAALRATGRDVFMQVNLSAAEIAQPLLVEQIADIIREADLPDGVLRIELTEQAALRDYVGALGALAAFRAAGAGIVLDDFGAGHSSFAWLAEFPANGVKLDPRLVRMSSQPRAARIVSALTSLIRDLGMESTAEGVEDRADAPGLIAIGCDFVQGFAYDMPLRAPDLDFAFDPPDGRGPPEGGL